MIALLGCSRYQIQAEQLLSSFPGPLETFEMEQDDPWDSAHWLLRRAGLQVVFNKRGQVHCLFMFNGDRNGYERFSDPLPHGLSWAMTHAEALALLGPPAQAGEDDEEHQRWCRWHCDEYELYLNFMLEPSTLFRVTVFLPTPGS